MLPFALDPSVILGNLDAQAARPVAPNPPGQDSFDDHLQQATQAGSNANGTNGANSTNGPGANLTGANSTGANSNNNNPQSNSPAPADTSNKPSSAPATNQSRSDRAKKTTADRATEGKGDHAGTHSTDNGTAKSDAQHATAATTTAASDDSTAAASAAAKANTASSDAKAAATATQQDTTKTASDDAAKSNQSDAAPSSAPVGFKLATDPVPAPTSGTGNAATGANPANAATAKTAPASPALVDVAAKTPAPTTGAKSGGKARAGDAKDGVNSSGHHSRSTGSAKASQAGADVNQSAVNAAGAVGDSASQQSGNPPPGEFTVSQQQSPAEKIAAQVENSAAVVPVAATAPAAVSAESAAVVSAATQAVGPAIDTTQGTVSPPTAPVAGAAPVVTAVNNLTAPTGTSASVQRDDSGAPATTSGTGTSGAGGVANARFVQRVAKAFQTVGDQGGSLRLRLSPPDLGSLKLNLTVSGGVLSAHVQAETIQARDTLLENLPALRERLAEHNIKVDQFNVELFDSSTGGSSDQPHGNSDPQQAYAPAPPRNRPQNVVSASSAQSPAAASPAPQVTAGGLNVVI